jgi:hypothetical protein
MRGHFANISISAVQTFTRGHSRAFGGHLSPYSRRNTRYQDGQQWYYHMKANQRQAFNLTSLTRNGFLAPPSNLTSLTSHLTHAVRQAGPSTRFMGIQLQQSHIPAATPSTNFPAEPPPPTAHRFATSFQTHTTHPRRNHSSYKPPPTRDHVATSEAQARRRRRSTRQGIPAPHKRLLKRSSC